MKRLLSLLVGLLLGAGALRAQPMALPSDVILLTTGVEVPGRVVTITPSELRYLPPTGGDTLRLAASAVFLVRYANGTREVLHAEAPPLPADLLPGLSEAQRRARARQDAYRYYQDHRPFWASLGGTLYCGPLLGVVAPAVISARPVAESRLAAPTPGLLADPTYGPAYRREALRRKRGRAWGGYGTGAAIWVVLIGLLASGTR